jgi:hypothetical protein
VEGSISFCNFNPAQVHLTEEKSGEVAAAPPPEVQYLDISWQKNLLEEARIGITTIHQVKTTANLQTFKSEKIVSQEKNLLLQLFVDGYIEKWKEVSI